MPVDVLDYRSKMFASLARTLKCGVPSALAMLKRFVDTMDVPLGREFFLNPGIRLVGGMPSP